MKKTIIVRTSILMAGFLATIFSWNRAFTSGSGSGGGYTNAPGESSCYACHTGSPLTTNASMIVLKMNGSTTLKYKSDTVYNMTLTATLAGIDKFGFLITSLKDSTNTGIGTFATTSSDVQTQIITSTGRSYAFHTSTGTAGMGSRTWNFTWKAPHGNIGTVSFYVAVNAANGDLNLTGDQIFLRTLVASYQPPVTPDAFFSFSPTTACAGDSITMKDSSSRNPTSWAWTFSGGTPHTSTLQNPKVAFTLGTQTITLVSSNKFGAGPPTSKIINIIQIPGDTVYRSGPTTFCDGDSVLLIGDFTGSSFKWSTGATTQTISVKKPGTYFVTASNGQCFKQSKPVTISTLPKPALTLIRTIANDTICTGDSVKFNLTTGASTIKYYVNGKLVTGASGKSLAIANLTGTNNKVFAIVFDSLGCKSDTSKIYKVVVRVPLAAPLLSVGPNTTSSVNLTWKAVKGATGYQVSTDSGKTWMTPNGTLNHTVTGLASNTYIAIKIRATDVAPCYLGNISSLVLNTLPCSQTTYKIKEDSTICPKGTAKVIFSKISAPHFGIILNGVAIKDTFYTFTPQADTVIPFKMIDSAKINCGSFNVPVPIKVTQLPLSFSISANKPAYCGDLEPAVVTATGKFQEYDYFVNGKLKKTDTSHTYVSNNFNDGDRVVFLGKVSGCFSDSSKAVILHKLIVPVSGFKDTLGFDRSVVFENTSVNSIKQLWYFGDSTTDTSKNPIHTYANNKSYSVALAVFGQGGCNDSISQSVTITKLTKASGIETGIKPGSLIVKPNPFTNEISVSFYNISSPLLHLEITDLAGRMVKDMGLKQIASGKNEFRLSMDELKPGTYLLRMNDGSRQFTRKMVKE